jgi:hypothetical protein
MTGSARTIAGPSENISRQSHALDSRIVINRESG